MDIEEQVRAYLEPAMTIYQIFSMHPEFLVGPALTVAAICFGFIGRVVYVPPSEGK